MKNTDTCGVRWVEFNKKEQAVKKERFFKSAEAREAFVKKVQEKDNFWEFDSFWN